MNEFRNKFLQYTEEQSLFTKSHKLLVGLSGGCDSVVLIRLLKEAGFQADAAHCNFRLRGENSENDEAFVKDLAAELNIQLYTRCFDTRKFADEQKYSIEEAARVLRYEWFEDIRKSKGYDYIVTAHHLNDKIETFFINLIAGTGIKGLRSIKAKNGYLARPLLFARREEIENFAYENNYSFRTDESNYDISIIRNRIRHKILPEIEKINPSFMHTMTNNFSIFADFESIYNEYTTAAKSKISDINNEILSVDISKLNNIQGKISVLYEILIPFGFNSSQIKFLIENLDKLQTGKTLLSTSYKIIKDRNSLLVFLNDEKSDDEMLIHNTDSLIDNPLRITIEHVQNDTFFQIKEEACYAFFDADKLSFPLMIRKRKEGDRFKPLGMKGTKLVSDFITDLKLSYFEKEKLYLLTNRDDILWVIGYRIDDRYKVTDKTQNVLVMQLQ